MFFGLLVAAKSANAGPLWDTQQLSSVWDIGTAPQWETEMGPFTSDTATYDAAYDWCRQTADYVTPGLDCEPHPGFPDTLTYHDGGFPRYQLVINVYRNGGFHGTIKAVWVINDTSDLHCVGDVVDRVRGYNCVHPATQHVLEPPKSCPEIASAVGNPCDPASGNKSQAEVDYRVAAAGAPSFVRYYNSKGSHRTGDRMAPGWRHTYSRAMDEAPDRKPTIFFAAPANQSDFYYTAADACTLGWQDLKATVWSGSLSTGSASFAGGNICTISVGGAPKAYLTVRSGGAWYNYTPPPTIRTITRPNGSSIRFEQDGNDWVAPLNGAVSLEPSGNDWVFTDANDIEETYDTYGRLISISQRNGQTETLDYELSVGQGGDGDPNTLDRVTGPFGHTLSLTYDISGRLASITTPDGTVTYAIGTEGNLATVTYPDLSMRQYVYEDPNLPHHLTGIIDENDDRFATWAYDDAGRAVSSEHAGGREDVDLAYNGDGTTTIASANGASRTYTFATAGGRQRLDSISGDVCSDCVGGDIRSRTYDANGFLEETIDWNGNVTRTARNTRGQVETLTEAFGSTEQRVTTTQWHADHRLPSTVTSPQNVTSYTYDANGNVLTVTVAGGGKSRVWSFAYNTNGLPLTIDGPRTDVSDVTTLAYYGCSTGAECGQLASVTNALGHVTTLDTYDAAGRVTEMTDASGLVTTLAYDGRGRVTSATETPSVGSARTTSMSYDGVGQLQSMTLPNGVALTYTYDTAHYLTSITDNLGNKTTYSYDVMGDKTAESTYDPGNNLKHAIAYTNDLNRRLDTIESGGFMSDLTFDLVGNLTAETEPGGAVTQHVYDALNRLQSTTDALTGVAAYSYDDHDNLIRVVAPNGATTDYAYDALDNLLSETSADRGLLTYTYDDAGNRLTVTDARGITATYAYDALSRLVSVSYPDAQENVSYTYDDAASNGIGRLRSITDQSGTTTYAYDEFGNVVSDERVIAGVTYTTTYAYDSADNVSSITYPSGRTVDYVRDTAGQVTQVTSTMGGVPSTLISNATYEPFGPLASLTYGNGVTFGYDYGLDYRTVSITSTGVAGKQYSYDTAANISAIDDTLDASLSQSFSHDELRRLTAGTLPPQTGVDYADRVLANNPLAYWRLDETSGTVAVDLSGNGFDATYVGPVILGEPGMTAGTNNSMRIAPVGSSYATSPTMTGITVTGLEVWFQTDPHSNYRDVVSLANASGDRTILIHYKDGKLRLIRGSSVAIASDGVISSSEPHHVAVWYEATSNTTYMMIDGVLQQDTYPANALAVSNPWAYMGAFQHYGSPYTRYHGNIDEFALYDGAVTAYTFATGAGGAAVGQYTYDANGNRLSFDDGSGLQMLGYQPLSNRLATVDGVTMQHDAAGNRTADQGGSRTFSYDDTGRLSGVAVSGSAIATYTHNALGQRTRKTTPSADGVYIYDLAGNLLAEHDASGGLIRDYAWMNNVPVAQTDAVGVVSYLHVDHLGTPRLATNDSQAVVWRWASEGFGIGLPDGDPDGDGNPTTVNLRFPGQYYDEETGFHYNYHRTYDPSTGRYLESDPIGLSGGLNTYGYVSQNPLRYIDPRGQYLTLPAGAAAGRACLSNGVCAGTMAALTGASLGCLMHPSLCSEIITEACADVNNAIDSLLKPFQNNLLPLDAGGEEWGRRNDVGAKEGRRRAHGVKQRDNMSRPKDDYKVDPETGDVIDPEGEVIGNLEDDYK